MAESCLLAPVLLWLIFQAAKAAEGALEENRSAAVGPPLLLPAPEDVQDVPSTQGDFRRGGNTSECTGLLQQARPHRGPLEALNISISMGLEMSFQISASVLVFAAFCGCGILMPLCHPQKLRIRGTAWKWLSIYANGLACLASVLALVALILWSYEQGLSAVLILPIVLLLYVILVTALVVATVACKLDVLHEITDKAAQRKLDFTTPGGVILDTVISGILMKHIRLLQEKGCAEPIDPTAVLVGAAGMCLLPFTAIVIVHCMDMKRRTAEERVSRREKWRKAFPDGKFSPL